MKLENITVNMRVLCAILAVVIVGVAGGATWATQVTYMISDLKADMAEVKQVLKDKYTAANP